MIDDFNAKASLSFLDTYDIQATGLGASIPYGLQNSKTAPQSISIGLESQWSRQIETEIISTTLSASYSPATIRPVPIPSTLPDPIIGSANLSFSAVADPIIGLAIISAPTPLGETPDLAANTSTTGTISVGGSSTGVVGTTGDRDWFRISLNAGSTYRFNLNGSTLSDPTLHLRNASGTSLAFNDDFGGGRNSQITFTAATSGTYFLDAGAFFSGLGSYTLAARRQ